MWLFFERFQTSIVVAGVPRNDPNVSVRNVLVRFAESLRFT